MDAREQRGLELAATKRFKRKGELWIVPSQSGSGSYVVDPRDGSCSCPDHETRGVRCKHVFAVVYTLQRETAPDGTTVVTETTTVVKRQYPQHPNYNAAQTNEKPVFTKLLRELCSGIPQPPQGRGRPRLPLRDVVFAATMKVYLEKSGRRSASFFNELVADGFMTRAPHYNSVFNYLEDSTLAPLLKGLVEESSNPLRSVERAAFAVDATGFATSTYASWFVEKHGGPGDPPAKRDPTAKRRTFVKLHAFVGTRTHIVTAAEATEGSEGECPHLPELLARTAARFKIEEVCADKGYLSNVNFEAIEKAGASAFIPFRDNSRGDTGSETWQRLFHFFALKRDEFLSRYHQRSNVETVFHMIKSKFGPRVRSRCAAAQRNEALLKVLCHNLCVLVSTIYELGIEPTFWNASQSATAAAS